MEPNDDIKLRGLLREWQAPEPPPSLQARVLGTLPLSPPWWRFLLSGYIRVPAPVAICLAILMLAAAWRTLKPAAPVGCESAAICTLNSHC